MTFSLLMVDVVKFKAHNDTYGHAAGDECLKLLSQCLAAAVPSGDIVGRLGGEEFAIILAEKDEHYALVNAERIRSLLRDKGLPNIGVANGIVSVSLGLACYAADEGWSHSGVLQPRG